MSGAGWIASYVALWVTVLVLSVACIVLLRRGREVERLLRAPDNGGAGAEQPGGARTAPMSELFDYRASPLTVLVFTKPDCEICATIEPHLDTLGERIDGVRVEVISLGPNTRPIYEAFGVRDTPYAVGIDDVGLVRAAGSVGSVEDVDALARRALAARPVERPAM